VNVIKQFEGPTSSVACSLEGSWGSGKSQAAVFIVERMKLGNPKQEEKLLSPTVAFTLTCGIIEIFVQCVYVKCIMVTNFVHCLYVNGGMIKNCLEDGSSYQISISSSRTVLLSSEYFGFTRTCCKESCECFFTLPMKNVKKYIKQVFGCVPHDVESGVDAEQLKKRQRSIVIGLCLIFLSPLPIIVYTYIFLYINWSTLIIIEPFIGPD